MAPEIVVVTDNDQNETPDNDNNANNTELALTVGELVGRVTNLEKRMNELDTHVDVVELETETAQGTANAAINAAWDAEDTAAHAVAETEAIAETVVETLDDDAGDDEVEDVLEEVFLEPLVIETTNKDATPEDAPKRSWLDKSWKEWRNKA